MTTPASMTMWSTAFESLRQLRDHPTIPRNPTIAPVRLTDIQSALWPIHARHPRASQPMVFTVPIYGTLDIGLLQEALSEIVRIQHALRTRFPRMGGPPMQLIMPEIDNVLKVYDQRAYMTAEQIERQVAQWRTAVVDLVKGPPHCATLVPVSDTKHVLRLGFHHLCFDGWSWQLFVRELVNAYERIAARQRPGLPELPIQITDLARWEQQEDYRELAGRQVDYWRVCLDGLEEPPRLLVDHYRGDQLGVTHTFVFPGELVRRLRECRAEYGASLFVILLASLKLLLWRYTGSSDVCIEVLMANRRRTETRRLLGAVMNVAFLRTNIRGDSTFRGLVDGVRASVLGAMSNLDVSAMIVHETLVEEGRIPIVASRVQVDWRTGWALPVRLGAATFGERLPPVHEGLARGPRGETATTFVPKKFDLRLQFIERPDQLALRVIHRPDHINAQTVQEIVALYVGITRQALKSPLQQLSMI